MKKFVALFFVFAFGYFRANAFDDYEGYLGCKHKFGFGFDFHPLPVTLFVGDEYWSSAYGNPKANGLVLPLRFNNLPSTGDDYIDVPRFTLRTSDFFSYSINYEHLIDEYNSFGVDFIFRRSSIRAEHNNSSWLYPDYSFGTIDFALVSGLDLRLKYRHYFCESSGHASPHGIYVDYTISLPFTMTKYMYDNNGLSEHSSGVGVGVGVGKQIFLNDKITYNYGCATIFNFMTSNKSRYLVNHLVKDLEGNLYNVNYLQEPLKQPGIYKNNISNFLAFYFRMGYLIF